MTETSQTVGALAAALAKAQAEIEGAAKDRVNPHFKSSYATLASVWDACRPALSKHGLAVVQSPESDGPAVTVHTTLLHASGEWMRSSLTASARDGTPQSIGSALTYLRRYSLASMVGVAPEDDDGNDAQPRFDQRPQQQQQRYDRSPPAPEPSGIGTSPSSPPSVGQSAAKLAFELVRERLNKVPGYTGDEAKQKRKDWFTGVLGYTKEPANLFTAYERADAATKLHVQAQLEKLEAGVGDMPPDFGAPERVVGGDDDA